MRSCTVRCADRTLEEMFATGLARTAEPAGLKDESVKDGNCLPAPDAPAAEVADDLQDARQQSARIAAATENK